MSFSTPSFLAPLLLSLLPGIGLRRYWALINAFGSSDAVLITDPQAIPTLNHEAQSLLRELQQQGDASPLFQSASAIIDSVDNHQGFIISHEDTRYPPLLKEIYQPPPLLYLKGEVDNLCLPQLAIVGSRHASHGGLENTRLFSTHLARCGFVITSGLALGIDGAAHQAAIATKAKTIAVMATGIDTVYPKRHRTLADQIVAEGGTLLTEFPPFSPPKANHFPRRNRIISGLSLGVIVIEAAIKSGSLITAHYALEQGREVFAVPSSIHNPQAKGCHQLIKHGAALVENSNDIIEHLQGLIAHVNSVLAHHVSTIATQQSIKKYRETTCLDENERLIMAHVGFGPANVEQLIQSSGLPSQDVTAILMNLEINGWIKLSDWGYERV
ncbi:MAG: DNA processing protein [Candidatus Endobugula sp.]|jgi:DNA processing protein